jgi:hypothetical protein
METKDNQNFIFQLSNKNRSIRYFLLFIGSGIVFSGLGFWCVAKEEIYLLIGLVVIAIAYFFAFTKIKPSFVEFVTTEKEFQFNYYSVSSVTRDYQSIEIPFADYYGCEITTSVFGMKKELVLTVRSAYGLADYPPISISILSKNEIDQILYILNKIKERNNPNDN